MAKRKRLTPPTPQTLEPGTAAPETKSVFPNYPLGVAPKARGTQMPKAGDTQTPKARNVQPPIAHVAGDASAAAALAEVSAELTAARAQGRMVQVLALDVVDAGHLVRDRLVVDDAEMSALCQSLQARGQQTPIEVVQTAQGFGLISGWRRLSALRALYEQTGEARFGEVLALVRQPVDAADAYVAMVEENEIRVGLSYFERARIVLRAVEAGVYPDTKKALNGLFGSGSRAKRSKIKSFFPVVTDLGGALVHPAVIGERMGLALAQRLQEDTEFASVLGAKLRAQGDMDAQAEQAVLQVALDQGHRARAGAKAAPKEELSPGVFLQRKGRGIFLSGAGLTPQVEARVRAALKG